LVEGTNILRWTAAQRRRVVHRTKDALRPTCDASDRDTAAMQDAEEPQFVGLPDSDDARLFIELSGYQSDLTEASEALQLALQGRDPESPHASAVPFLIGYGVIAYCRATSKSNIRKSMTTVVEIPDEYAETHGLVWEYRNRAVAHSQSDLTSTYVVASRWDRFEGGLDVQAITLSQPLPWLAIERLCRLVDRLTATMDEVMKPIRDRLAAHARQMRDAGVSADHMRPAFVAKPASEFSARTDRSPFPVGTAIYVELVD
jgi:hypothetical protein